VVRKLNFEEESLSQDKKKEPAIFGKRIIDL
jgi:hypothetical protein